MTDVFEISHGTLPLLVSVPHVGTQVPPDVQQHLTEPALALPDTDWFVDRLYEFAGNMGASLIRANFSRYVIDLNRPPDDAPLYPGKAGTGLCPMTLFNGQPIYREGAFPDHAEIERRLSRYWKPYHDQVSAELERLLALHGKVLLWDAHSIRSRVPRLFDGRLPDLNFGTADSTSCGFVLADRVFEAAKKHGRFSCGLNGRFKGGYITRHYGNPDEGVHAIQLEIAQASYMDETDRPVFSKSRAAVLMGTLEILVTDALESVKA